MRGKLICTLALLIGIAATVQAQDEPVADGNCFIMAATLGGQPEEYAGVFVEPLSNETVISWEEGFPEIEPESQFDNQETGGVVYTYDIRYSAYIIEFSTSRERFVLFPDAVSMKVAHVCLAIVGAEGTPTPEDE